MKTAFIALLSVVLHLAGPRPVQAASVWLNHADTAFAEAKQSGKMVLVDLYADWCGWCKVMEERVFPSPEFARLAGGFVLLRVDVEDGGEGSELAARYDSSALPTLLLSSSRAARRSAWWLMFSDGFAERCASLCILHTRFQRGSDDARRA